MIKLLVIICTFLNVNKNIDIDINIKNYLIKIFNKKYIFICCSYLFFNYLLLV